MTRQEKTIGVVLLAVAALWLGRSITSSRPATIAQPRAEQRPPARIPLPEKVPPPAPAPEPTFDLEKMIDSLPIKSDEPGAALTHDPFKRIDLALPTPRVYTDISELKLTGIIWTSGEPLVLINNEMFQTGDDVPEFHVQEIRPREVVITRGVEKYVLKLFAEDP